MSGLDTMLQTILEEANAEAQAILDRAREDAANILARAKSESDRTCEAIHEEAKRQAVDISLHAESSAEMRRRRALLAEKQRLLNQAVEAAKAAVLALPDKDYFYYLIRLAAQNAEAGTGMLVLSSRDRARMPSDFADVLNRALPEGANLTISPEGQDFEGGCILQYGDIDKNCSLSAIFDENREQILDAAQQALFG